MKQNVGFYVINSVYNDTLNPFFTIGKRYCAIGVIQTPKHYEMRCFYFDSNVTLIYNIPIAPKLRNDL
jgi:hypothetical protein